MLLVSFSLYCIDKKHTVNSLFNNLTKLFEGYEKCILFIYNDWAVSN